MRQEGTKEGTCEVRVEAGGCWDRRDGLRAARKWNELSEETVEENRQFVASLNHIGRGKKHTDLSSLII